MDGIISFIASVNKISLIAFLGVLGFLVYEVILLRREQLKKQKPNLPQFNTATVIDKKVLQQQAATVVPTKKVIAAQQSKSSPILIILLVIAIISFAGISIYIVLTNRQQQASVTNVPKIVVNEVSSPGLKVFDANWIEITDKTAPTILSRGGKVLIGIQTIDEADIDRARIKVNQKDWNIHDITERFNAEKKMYYIEYTVASGSSQLKIDAQLHSNSDGWLGD